MNEILDFLEQIILRIGQIFTGTETFRAVHHQDGEIWREKKETSSNVKNTDMGFVPAASDTHMNVYTFALFGKIPHEPPPSTSPCTFVVLLYVYECSFAISTNVFIPNMFILCDDLGPIFFCCRALRPDDG